MKEAQPFNPVPISAHLNLAMHNGTTEGPLEALNTTIPVKSRAKAKRKRRPRSAASHLKRACETQWGKLKSRLQAQLNRLGRAKLKQLLLGCVVATGALLLAVMVASKQIAMAVLLLALLGFWGGMRLRKHLRNQPIPC